MNVQDSTVSQAVVPCSLGDIGRYFVRLGSFGFGGPIALAGYMHTELVEKKRWISEREYLDGLALAQLAPGPLAAQLAMYLGWVRFGALGATVASVAFTVPSLLIVLGLASLYLRFGGMSWVQDAFYGIGAAVIAIIVRSAYKLTKLSLAKDRLLWAIFVVNAVLTAWTESEIVLVFLASGLLVLLVKARATSAAAVLAVVPPWLITGLHGPASEETHFTLLWYFAKAGAFVFGSGLAIVPFLHGGVVNELHWLNEQQFLDAVAVAMITPGPVVITVAFIGYLVGGVLGALAAAIGVFVPCYLFVLLPAPYFQRYGANPHIKLFVQGVTAAAAGAIGGAAFVLGRRAIYDLPTLLIAVVAFAALFKFKKAPEPLLIAAAGVVGLAMHSLTDR